MLRWFRVGFSVAGIAVALAACADSTKPAATAADPPRTTVSEVAGIKVTILPDGPSNPMCIDYCKRFGACWLNLSNADPMIDGAHAEERCLLEQTRCQRQTADLHCCALLDDCGDFAHCIETSHNVVADCSSVRVETTSVGR